MGATLVVRIPPWFGVGGASVRCAMCRGAEAVLRATERRSSVCDAVLLAERCASCTWRRVWQESCIMQNVCSAVTLNWAPLICPFAPPCPTGFPSLVLCSVTRPVQDTSLAYHRAANERVRTEETHSDREVHGVFENLEPRWSVDFPELVRVPVVSVAGTLYEAAPI